MATQYTPILQLALPVTGELNGTWGDVVNDNITSMVEQAIAGMATISTWTANAHTLTTADGTTDEARCAMLLLQTGSGGTALTGVGQVICPALTKLYVVKNDAAYAVTIKTSGGSGISVSAGDSAFVFCDGTNVVACVTQITNGHITGNLVVDGNANIKGNTTLGDAVGDTVTVNGTTTFTNANPTLSQGTANRVLFLNASKVVSDAAGLTWDGTTMSATRVSTSQVNITGQGDLRLEDTTGGEYVALQAPSSLGASYTLTLPVDDGTSGQALITDGSGNLSWSTSASGDVYGPASSTNNGIALFDGTTGKLLKDSASTDGLIYGLRVGRGGGGINSNTAFGTSALAANTTGVGNTVIGYQAGQTNAVGRYSTFVGQWAGQSSDADYNTAIGYASLFANTTGTSNTAIGMQSATALISGSSNTAVGVSAMQASTIANYNVAAGVQSLRYSEADHNTGLGYQAAYANSTGAENTAAGSQALRSNTTGAYNTALGRHALYSNTTASNNTAVGYQAGFSNTTGYSNTYLGLQSGYANQTGAFIVAIGHNALQSNTVGSNIAIGVQVAYANTTGYGNVAIGPDSPGQVAEPSFRSNTTGYFNTAIGSSTLAKSTTGNWNTALGTMALYANTTAGDNTAVGAQALFNNTTGADNTALGRLAAFSNTTGGSIVAVGRNALFNNTTGAANNALGRDALYNNTTGSYNTAIGYSVLFSNTTASNNTAVGYQAGYNSTGKQNTLMGNAAGYGGTFSGNANTCIGNAAGQNLTTGSNNTFVGASQTDSYGSGGLVTTGSKNTILGSYTGNQGGLDIRTASNYIVLSDGDGNPKAYLPGASSSPLKLALLQQADATTEITTVQAAVTVGRTRMSIATGSTTNVVNGYQGGVAMVTSVGQGGGTGRDFQYTWLVTWGWNAATVLFTNSYGSNTFTVTFGCSNGHLTINHNGGANVEFVIAAVQQGGWL